MQTINISNAREPIVLAVDIGSSSVRALLYDGRGSQIEDSETQHSYSQQITDEGGSESGPTELLDLVVRCIDGAVTFAAGHHSSLGAVAMTSFWHGLLGLDDTGAPATPVYMWSDKRSGADAAALSNELEPVATHQRTGCRIHSSYWPAKIRWLARECPERYASVSTWVSFTDFVSLQLLGTLQTSVSMASGTGLLNSQTLDWDRAMLQTLGLDTARLPVIVDRSEPLKHLLPKFADRWPVLDGVPWFPAIGDGAAANIGASCVGDAQIAMTIGTSAAMRIIVRDQAGRKSPNPLPARIWSYRLDRQYTVLGGALSNGGNVTGWIAEHMAGGAFDALTDAANAMQPDAHGLTVLPFLAGERSPSWNDKATGAITGLRLSTTAGDMFRATLEATAYRMAAIYDDLQTLVPADHEIHANGAAVLSSPLWLQIIADVLGHRLDAVDAEAEASARGAAVCALQSLGAITSLDDFDHAVSESYEPNPPHHATYRAARQRQTALESAINMLTQSH